MKLTAGQVKKVAKLANLPVVKQETEKYSQQLSKILDYMDQLNKVDTEGVEPTFNVCAKQNVFREDIVGECLNQEDALANAVNNRNGYFVTKGVLENE